jgi:hypothetical protein
MEDLEIHLKGFETWSMEGEGLTWCSTYRSSAGTFSDTVSCHSQCIFANEIQARHQSDGRVLSWLDSFINPCLSVALSIGFSFDV